jgi:hypothetical protein
MPQLLAGDTLAGVRTGADERLARAELRRQIGRLERELAGLFADAFRRVQIDGQIGGIAAEPRVLGLGELERVRDELATRIGEARLVLDERAELETRNRELLRRMLADPGALKWVRVSRHDIGEPGCGAWHSRPRFGVLGLLMGWWRVKVSSGCPLPARLAAVEQKDQEPGASPGPLGLLSLGGGDRSDRDHGVGDRADRSDPDRDRSGGRARRPRRP